MKNYKFSIGSGILWTAGIGLMCVGLDAILALWVSVVGNLLLLSGFTVATSTVGIIGLLFVVLTTVLYSFSKED